MMHSKTTFKLCHSGFHILVVTEGETLTTPATRGEILSRVVSRLTLDPEIEDL